MFYIYLHKTKDEGVPFYIGKGYGKRAYVKSHRSKFWKRIVAKHGYIIELVEENLTEQEALLAEVNWIKKFGRRDLNTGTLVNFTDGGEGTVGRKVSEKTKAAVADSNRKRVASDINRQKTGSLYKGKFGKEHNRSKAVKCSNGQTYGSISEAARTLGIDHTTISLAIKQGRALRNGMHFEIAA